ncbi:MAG: WD40 repeat domain-containing protein [Gaiellaceae bacterium]
MDPELGRLFLTTPVPDELDAQRRAWSVVRTAYAEREPVSRRRGLRPVLALAVLAALVAAALSPPGRALGDWIRDNVRGEEPPQPALARLPAAGRVLVTSEQGTWVVNPDGTKRRLGEYDDASWSPRGFFVIATSGRRLVALEPEQGGVRWSVSRSAAVSDPRWSGGGLDTRVAYRSGDSLRVVAGDGAPDRLLARSVAPVAPAWKPGDGHVLAYADPRGRVHVVAVDSRRELWRSRPLRGVRQLVWSADGRRLLAVTRGDRHPLLDGRGRVSRTIDLPSGHVLVGASFAPTGRTLAYTSFDPTTEQGAVIVDDDGRRRALQTVEGRLEEVEWSPDGRWLLVAWPVADQWLFLRLPGGPRLNAVGDIRREFDPGGDGGGAFPRVAGWVPPAPGA